MPTPRLFLIDGMAIAYRAYFAFLRQPLKTSRGENVSAIYGFVSTILTIIDNEKPEYIAVAFDTKEPTFRHKLYKEYKAHREEMPEDMVPQLAQLKDVTLALGVPLIEAPGFEADDIIGTLVKRAEKKGMRTMMVTFDKDYMQLVSTMTSMFKPPRGGEKIFEVVDTRGVVEKFGVAPEHVIDVLALIGDTSDNIPGVKGIGEKTAIPLIQEYGTLENLYKNLEKIERVTVREKLRNNRPMAELSKTLVTIDINVPLDVKLESLKARSHTEETLIPLLKKFEFRSLLKRFDSGKNEATETPSNDDIDEVKSDAKTIKDVKHSYTTITSEKELRELVKKLGAPKILSFDTETTSKDAMRAKLVGISLSVKSHEAYYIAVECAEGKGSSASLFEEAKTKGQNYEAINPETAAKILQPLLENRAIKKVGQNAKYDALVLSNYGIKVSPIAFDTMIAASLLDQDSPLSMDALSRQYLGYDPVPITALIGTGKEQLLMSDVPLETLSEYAAEDADVTMQLFTVLSKKISENKLITVADEIEFPLIEVLATMEHHGVRINGDALAATSKEFDILIRKLIKEIYSLAGSEFNINSTKQLGEVLFERMNLPTGKKTKTGYSTDVSVLEELTIHHPIAEKLLSYRELTKLQSTYIDALPRLINPRTGCVHTSYSQTVAATGRLSSNSPNLQNIPIRSELGREIRKSFVPRAKNSVMFASDYSQIELRIMAHVSGDKGLLKAFTNKEDIHTTTAAQVFNVESGDVTRDMRRKAKEVNFGIMYGIGPFGLARRLGISQGEAKTIITTYFEKFPKIKSYIDETIASTHKKEYAETLKGRRRYFKEINSKNAAVRATNERAAINMPIQGTAAEMLKIAMINIHNAFLKKKLESKMILQVHDELVFDVLKNELDDVREIVEKNMIDALPLDVPMEVDSGFGKSWFEAH